jgi:hypothetical protein
MSRILVAMRHTWIARSFAALFALWFAVSLTEPAALHACAMHGGGAVAGHHHASAAHASAAHDQGPSGSHGAPKHCTCLGSCTTSNGSAIVPSADTSIGAVATLNDVVELPAFRARVVTAPPFFLPFANGPPAPPVLA